VTEQNIPDKLYFKIGEVSRITRVKPYVLRYWESEFKIIKPQKSASKQRVYTRRDIEMILEIKNLLYKEKFTLEGAKKQMKVFQQKRMKHEQIELPLTDNSKYVAALSFIKQELFSIRKILETGA
jgi:DNA-binding transcriptional MerR regulator